MKPPFIVLFKTNKRCQMSAVFSLIPEIKTKSEIVLIDNGYAVQ